MSTITLDYQNGSLTSSNTNLTLQPNGSGNVVIVPTGSKISTDTITSTTASTDLTLTATGSNVVFSKNLNLGNNQALSFRAENVSSNPTPGHPGRLVWNTTSGSCNIDNGVAFTSLKNLYSIVSTLTSNATASNTTFATIVAGQAISTANYQVGSVIKVYLSGTMIWASSALQITTFAGLAFQPNVTLGTAFASPQPWKGEITTTIQAIGGLGAMVGTAIFTFPTAAGTWQTQLLDASETNANLGNLATGGLSVSWGTASPSNSFTITQLQVVLVNGV